LKPLNPACLQPVGAADLPPRAQPDPRQQL